MQYFYLNRFISSMSSTIYALSSGQGRCAVSIIRISGPNSRSVLFNLARFNRLPKPRTAFLRKLFHHEDDHISKCIDRSLVLWFPAPQSFTGEDSVELHVHGGRAVVNSVLNALSKLENFCPAEAGDFTKRSFCNGKLDLTQVEGLGDLIAADTESQLTLAIRQLDGELGQLYSKWRHKLMDVCAKLEADIDFGEEENLELKPHIAPSIENLISEIKQHLTTSSKGERVRQGVRLTIVGRSNAGKSSLFNKLCQRPKAIVSAEPGTTRDLLEATLDIGTYAVLLTDTAGLRENNQTNEINDVELEGIRRAKIAAAESDVKLIVIDWSDFLTESEGKLIYEKSENDIIVINKIDLMKENFEQIIRLPNDSVKISCKNGEGIEFLIKKLIEKLERICANPNSENPIATNARHAYHCRCCLECLQNIMRLLDNDDDVTLAANELQIAISHIGKLTGKITNEDILDIIFSKFCIGK